MIGFRINHPDIIRDLTHVHVIGAGHVLNPALGIMGESPVVINTMPRKLVIRGNVALPTPLIRPLYPLHLLLVRDERRKRVKGDISPTEVDVKIIRRRIQENVLVHLHLLLHLDLPHPLRLIQLRKSVSRESLILGEECHNIGTDTLLS